MKKTKADSITDILPQYLREYGFETPLNELRAVRAWSELLGPDIARVSRNIKIYNRTLFVEITSPALRANLLMMRKQIVKKINDHVKADVISDVVIK